MSGTFFTIAALTGIVVLIVGVVGSIAQGFHRKRGHEMTSEERLQMFLKLNEDAKQRYEEWRETCAKIDAEPRAKNESQKGE